MLILPFPAGLTLIVHRVKGGDFVVPVYISVTADAVSRERVAAPRTIARSAAVVSKTPVSHHASVTMWPRHPRLAGAVTIAGVAEGH